MRSTARVLSFEDLNTWHKCVATSPEYCDKIQNGLWVGCMDCAQQLWLQVASAKMAAMSSPGTFLKREMETIRLHPCKDAFQTFDLNTSTWFGYQWHSSHSFKCSTLSAHFEASVITSYHGSLVCWNDPTPCFTVTVSDWAWICSGESHSWYTWTRSSCQAGQKPDRFDRAYTSAGSQVLHTLNNTLALNSVSDYGLNLQIAAWPTLSGHDLSIFHASNFPTWWTTRTTMDRWTKHCSETGLQNEKPRCRVFH